MIKYLAVNQTEIAFKNVGTKLNEIRVTLFLNEISMINDTFTLSQLYSRMNEWPYLTFLRRLTHISGLIISSFSAPTPDTTARSSTFLNLPIAWRYSTIFCAIVRVIPGSVINSSSLAVLTFSWSICNTVSIIKCSISKFLKFPKCACFCFAHLVKLNVFNHLPPNIKDLLNNKKWSTLKKYLLENCFHTLEKYFNSNVNDPGF